VADHVILEAAEYKHENYVLQVLWPIFWPIAEEAWTPKNGRLRTPRTPLKTWAFRNGGLVLAASLADRRGIDAASTLPIRCLGLRRAMRRHLARPMGGRLET
jgi:hypothetical protein